MGAFRRHFFFFFFFVLVQNDNIILTHCILIINRLSHTIYWKSPISILGTSGYKIYIFLEKMAKLIANSGDPDKTLRSAASDLGLHCLPITLLRVSRLQWVNLLLQLSPYLELW